MRTDSDASKVLQLSQISRLVDSTGHLGSFKVTFSNFKHSYNQRPFSLLLSRRDNTCPVQALSEYLSLRGATPGPLFQTSLGLSVSRTSFSQRLFIALKK